jgi:S-adenosylmethionine:tRNA ribosyltransferase-isomerase
MPRKPDLPQLPPRSPFTKTFIKLKQKGVQTNITLHVGLGTFQNLRPEKIKNKELHSEFMKLSHRLKRLNQAKQSGKRIIAVGTTSVRTLESAAIKNNVSLSSKGKAAHTERDFYQIIAGKNHTEIFIFPPYKFKFVDALITNFHLPESSLYQLLLRRQK